MIMSMSTVKSAAANNRIFLPVFPEPPGDSPCGFFRFCFFAATVQDF